MTRNDLIHNALQTFARTVRLKMTQLTVGEPEEQLRGPFDAFMTDFATAVGWNIVCTGETPLPSRLGKPDFAVHLNGLLMGYVELKAPGTGAKASRFKGHNRLQWKRFAALPNILYTDGNEWALYRDGRIEGKLVRLAGNIESEGPNAVVMDDASSLHRLLIDFLSWRPIIPQTSKGHLSLRGFAALIAPICRILRDDVTDALKDAQSPLHDLASVVRHK